MVHLFRATLMGFERKWEFISFSSDQYSQKEAEDQFKRYRGYNIWGYPYTGFEYLGKKYYEVIYLGEFEEEKAPRNGDEFINYLCSSENTVELKKLE